jgi:hypothetical protein
MLCVDCAVLLQAAALMAVCGSLLVSDVCCIAAKHTNLCCCQWCADHMLAAAAASWCEIVTESAMKLVSMLSRASSSTSSADS